jgi:hypothetical protein
VDQVSVAKSFLKEDIYGWVAILLQQCSVLLTNEKLMGICYCTIWDHEYLSEMECLMDAFQSRHCNGFAMQIRKIMFLSRD